MAIKICPVCGIESKALHLHQRKHDKENKLEEKIQRAQDIEEAKYIDEARMLDIENDPTIDNPPVAEPLEGQDIPITETMATAPADVEPVTNVNNCEYQLIMNINNEQLECYTNNLKISLMSYARPIVTDGFITIKKGTAEFVKKMSLIQLKQIFTDPQSLEIFLSSFYALYGQPLSEQKVNNLV